MKKTVLTPVDFSEVSNVAIAHAAQFLAASKGELILFHVVKNSNELFTARRKLNALANEKRSQYKEITVTPLLRIGDIYEDIGNAALENEAELIIMGTHGLQGMQILTGSRALRVVSSSEVPFIIVQKETRINSSFENILLPITIDKDSKQKLSYVKHLALYFDSKVHLLAKEENDEFLNNKIQRDINFSKAYLKVAGIRNEVVFLENAKGVDSYLEYADKHAIDLVVFMNHPESVYTLFDAKVQRVITNSSRLPVLLINPRSTSFVNIFGNYSGQG